MTNKPDPIKTAHQIQQEKFSDAKVVLLAGSVVRGEHTPYSDLDLVVIYDEVPHAWRESFVYQTWPVEAFVHDRSTLQYFFAMVDCKSGIPSLPNMVNEGICIPKESIFSHEVKQLARHYLQQGPAKLSPQEIQNKRYFISDLIDDLRAPRNNWEARAIGVRLYPVLADFWLRSQTKWSAQGKAIPRALQNADTAFAGRFEKSFDLLFAHGETTAVVQLAIDVLQPFGGLFFAGYRLNAPPDWRQ